MDKAVLVIDMPVACLDCPFEDFLLNSSNQIVEDKPLCKLEPGLGVLEDEYSKPSWCPLKPMPKQFTLDEILMAKDVKTAIEMRAYNDCLDEILGETE